MKVYRDIESAGVITKTEIFNIPQCTYSGKDMGERSITATIQFATPIDFKIGDYVELQMQSLIRGAGMHGDVGHIEKFYIYTMPTIKKVSSPMSSGKAFEHTVIFYPAQYELGCVQMRDLGNSLNANNIIYTGFDNVTFYGGAKELMERIMLVLAEAYQDSFGDPLWDYKISPLVDEVMNPALELFPLSFSGNTVMEALLKLADKDGINTTFFINNRTIYVGYKRPYFCRVNTSGVIDTDPSTQTFFFKYGKTSHEQIDIDHGGLFDITKTLGKETPITKLFAYGASRNLNRYYCSDRLATGRFVNRLMLPSFSNDGKTDYILSEDGIKRFGIREGSKQFDKIYPSVRYMTYGDIRKIKYCIKIEASGLNGEDISNSKYPVARVQCYKVEPCAGNGDGTKGVNKLIPSVPPEDLAIYVHAVDKIVKVILYGGVNGSSNQKKKDTKVPTYDGTRQIPGACFLVHDPNFKDQHNEPHLLGRDKWFLSADDAKNAYENDTDGQKKINEIAVHQINYTDTYWLTDLYVFTGYNQTYFNREGYSAWAYPRLNSEYVIKDANGTGVSVAQDSLLVNEIVEVEPIVVEDTSAIIEDIGVDDRQKTFDVYLRDVGFKIDEQNAFGEKVFVFNTLKFSFLDGNLEGQEFEVEGTVVDSQSSVICAYNDDGSLNNDFFYDNGVTDIDLPQKAFNMGAIWRVRLNRTNMDDPDYSNLNIALPNNRISAKSGDHFVLLDLYMPDIYIHAAEARLLRESTKYLEANDNGSISYSINLDKVRMQQIPSYALQFREGLNVRMVDGDLDITTINRIRTIFNGELLSRTSTYETTYTPEKVERETYTYTHRDYAYFMDTFLKNNPGKYWYENNDPKTNILAPGGGENFVSNCMIVGKIGATIKIYIYPTSEDYNGEGELYARDNEIKMRLLERVQDGSSYKYKLTNSYCKLKVKSFTKQSSQQLIIAESDYPINVPDFRFYKSGDTTYFPAIIEYDVKYKHTYEGTDWHPNHNIMPLGAELYCPSKELVEFRQLKHYEVTIEAGTINLLKLTNNEPHFALLNNLSQESLYYVPEYTVIEESSSGSEWRRFKFSFNLGSEFNDSQDYYPALLYISDNSAEYVETKLISIVESDTEEMKDLPYANFHIDQVTIKITDSNDLANDIKEITATLSEQHNASAWVTLMNRVEQNAIEGEQNAKTAEALANEARRNYQALSNLRNHIFDPDGKCSQTFLQVMMTQVGADSMNYQLDNTRISVDGSMINCLCVKESDKKYHFKVSRQDTLRHYVYTSSPSAGNWVIPGSIDVTLDGSSVYFIAIKCSRTSNSGIWVCEPSQHKVDELSTDWYFNWGILTPDDSGNYTLLETRGNAYMYGDNLICGKIATIAGNSYFDLTRGNFVLGDGSGSALEYINGVLTIRGSKGDTDDILNRLGIVEKSAEQSTYVNVYIYGDVVFKYVEGSIVIGKKLCVVSKSAILTSCIEDNGFAGGATDPFNSSCLVVFRKGKGVTTDYNLYSVSSDILGVYDWGEKFDVSEDADVYVFSAQKDYIKYCVSNSFSEGPAFPSGGSGVWTIKDIKIGLDNNSVIKSVVAAEEDARTEALAGVISDIAEMQKQIDGEVSSYFYPNAPIVSETDESVRTDIEPMVEWLKNYTLTEGVYVLNPDARNELINNLGDTFTNTVDDTTNPLAGKSWRWCDATTAAPLPKNYITIRYTSDGSTITKHLHWHIITDTDALRALEAAKNAQATADGKCTTFLEIPTKGYNTGDLWILEDDNKHPEGKKGDILTANYTRATYNESDWSKKVKYTDDTALENLEIGGRNLLKDSKVMVVGQWALPVGEATYTKNEECSTTTMNAVKPMNCVNTCTLQTIDKKWKDKNIVSSVMVRTTTDDNIKCGIVLRKGGSGHVAQSYYDATYITTKAGEWTKVYTTFKCSVDAEDVTIYFVVSSSKNSAVGDKYDFKEWKIEYGTKATDWTPAPEDVDDAIAAVDSKSQALGYLKEALVQDTDTVGGIVATSQIHLRDWTGKWVDSNGVEYDSEASGRTKQYVYNAGLSGKIDDKVLMWGGGDYLKAIDQVQGLLSEVDKLPILLTKAGENSKIGCLNVISQTQIEVIGKNNTKIIIDGGTQNASIQLVKNGITYVKLTSDSIASTEVSQKTLTSYTFSGEPFFMIHKPSGAINKTLGTLSLPADSYSVNYEDFSHIRVDFGLSLNINGAHVTNVKIKFDIYLGSYLIGSCNATIASLQTTNLFTSHAVFIAKSMTRTKITGGSYDVTIKNAVVTCTYGGETKNMGCRITYVSFGKGGSTSTWNNGDITFTSVQDQMVTIGQNGVQIVSTSGIVQMMSDKGKAYIKMQGLPTDDDVSTLNTGQLYVHDIDFSDFKSKLQSTLHSDYFDVKSGVSGAVVALANSLPSSTTTIGIK